MFFRRVPRIPRPRTITHPFLESTKRLAIRRIRILFRPIASERRRLILTLPRPRVSLQQVDLHNNLGNVIRRIKRRSRGIHLVRERVPRVKRVGVSRSPFSTNLLMLFTRRDVRRKIINIRGNNVHHGNLYRHKGMNLYTLMVTLLGRRDRYVNIINGLVNRPPLNLMKFRGDFYTLLLTRDLRRRYLLLRRLIISRLRSPRVSRRYCNRAGNRRRIRRTKRFTTTKCRRRSIRRRGSTEGRKRSRRLRQNRHLLPPPTPSGMNHGRTDPRGDDGRRRRATTMTPSLPSQGILAPNGNMTSYVFHRRTRGTISGTNQRLLIPTSTRGRRHSRRMSGVRGREFGVRGTGIVPSQNR